MKRGRPIKYNNDEDRKQAIRESKTHYMLNKEWICEACGGHDYTLAGKWCHIKTKKHIYNSIIQAIKEDDDIELIIDGDNII